MFTRTALMFVVVAMLCCASFTLGGTSSRAKQDANGIPSNHAVLLALSHQQDLDLSGDQLQKLTTLREEMEKEFAPLKEQADAIQHQMQDLQQSGNPDQATAANLKQQADAVVSKVQQMFDRYGQQVGDLLTEDQRQKLMKFANASAPAQDSKEFVLNTIMQSREKLGITPQEFTKLMYLQADFIRAFAPIRERAELLQLEIQDKFAKAGNPVPPEYAQQLADFQKQVAALQSQFSEKAKTEVLQPDQKAKLEELLNGEHSSATTGG